MFSAPSHFFSFLPSFCDLHPKTLCVLISSLLSTVICPSHLPFPPAPQLALHTCSIIRNKTHIKHAPIPVCWAWATTAYRAVAAERDDVRFSRRIIRVANCIIVEAQPSVWWSWMDVYGGVDWAWAKTTHSSSEKKKAKREEHSQSCPNLQLQWKSISEPDPGRRRNERLCCVSCI